MNTQNPVWVRLSKPGQDNLRIFFFPFSGATAQVFRPLAAMLSPGIGAYAYELPGRGRRFHDPAFDRIDHMAQEAADGLQNLLEVNTFFFGHSLGGIIAFEAARELRRRGMQLPRHLFVSGVRAPHIPVREDTYHNLPQDAFTGKLKELGGTPVEILENPEMLEIMIPVLRKDFQAYETYGYQTEAPLPVPVTALGGKSDHLVTAQDITAWSQHTSSAFFSQMFEGDHFFLLTNTPAVMDSIMSKVHLQQRPW